MGDGWGYSQGYMHVVAAVEESWLGLGWPPLALSALTGLQNTTVTF